MLELSGRELKSEGLEKQASGQKSAPTSPLKEEVIDKRSEFEKDSILRMDQGQSHVEVRSEEDVILKETVLDTQDDVRSIEQS